MRYLLTVTLLSLGIGSVYGDDPQSETESQALPILTEAGYKPPQDKSLSSAEYVELGIPSAKRVWTGPDMVRAVEALTDLAKEHPEQLPRYQSKRSGELFARLTAIKNMDLYLLKATPLDQRFLPANEYFKETNNLMLLYLNAYAQHGAVADADLSEMLTALMRSASVMTKLYQELIPTITSADPDYKVRMKGLAQVKEGLATMINGAVQSLSERQTYRPSVRRQMAIQLIDSIPVILPMLPKEIQTETLKQFDEMISDEQLKDIRPALKKLESAVRKSIGKEKKL